MAFGIKMDFLKRYIEIGYGFAFAAVSLLWLVFEYILGFHQELIEYHAWFTNLFMLPAVFIMFKGINARRKQLGGHIRFGQAFQSGFFITLIVAMLSPALQVVFHKFINPDFFSAFREYSVNQEGVSAEQAAANFNLKSYAIQSLIGSIIAGTVTSLIIAAIISFRNKK
jgi:hypothetical protein